jgi:SPP1 family predicted phage head-tail adaptor
MIQSGRLREKATLVNFSTSTINEWGDQVNGSKTTTTVWCNVKPEVGKEINDAESKRYSQRAKFIFRYPDSGTTINNQTSITWDSRAWQIIGFQDPNGLKAELHVLAETSDNE